MSKSPNRHNKIFMRVEPLGEDIIEMIKTGHIKEDMDKKEMAKILRAKGWEADQAKKVQQWIHWVIYSSMKQKVCNLYKSRWILSDQALTMLFMKVRWHAKQ